MPKFGIFRDAAGHYRWRLKADNGLKVATSGESFDTKSNAERAARRVKALAPSASIVDEVEAQGLYDLLRSKR